MFHAAGGMGFHGTRELLHAGLLHGEDVLTNSRAPGLKPIRSEPFVTDGWRYAANGAPRARNRWTSGDPATRISDPFELEAAALRLLKGSLGRGIIKIVVGADPTAAVIDAPAAVFESQADFTDRLQSPAQTRPRCGASSCASRDRVRTECRSFMR